MVFRKLLLLRFYFKLARKKHAQLLIYMATHAMKLHDPANICMLKTHMFVLELDPAPPEKHAEFVYSSAGIRELRDPKCPLFELSRAALVDLLREGDPRLTMYVRSGAVYLAPIAVDIGTPLQHIALLGPPDDDWKGFLERATNKTLGAKDGMRIKRLQKLM
ncbi:hypothetical protein DFH08DRAFT_801052 [Mycena albidolilacea]|uniref:Uncharacterized protein n=1 Tax=Mycena albidolilacea TaxID=1033008 RepID=A0AAD7EYX9_9AGAR|nr:hypothetical protein DFH08DRAFT_801052 [Mycena albidolilacea]